MNNQNYVDNDVDYLGSIASLAKSNGSARKKAASSSSEDDMKKSRYEKIMLNDSNNNNDIIVKDEENTLLESLGSSLKSASVYEASVIREVTHKNVPPLDTSLSFPDLHSLIASSGSSSDNFTINQQTCPTIYKVYEQNVKKLQDEESKCKNGHDLDSPGLNKLRMKICILRTFLKQHYVPKNNTTTKKRGISTSRSSSSSSSTSDDKIQNLNSHKELQNQKLKEKQLSKLLCHANTADNNSKGEDTLMSDLWKNNSSNSKKHTRNYHRPLTTSERLEEIKNGSSFTATKNTPVSVSNTAMNLSSFGRQILLERERNQQIQHMLHNKKHKKSKQEIMKGSRSNSSKQKQQDESFLEEEDSKLIKEILRERQMVRDLRKKRREKLRKLLKSRTRKQQHQRAEELVDSSSSSESNNKKKRKITTDRENKKEEVIQQRQRQRQQQKVIPIESTIENDNTNKSHDKKEESSSNDTIALEKREINDCCDDATAIIKQQPQQETISSSTSTSSIKVKAENDILIKTEEGDESESVQISEAPTTLLSKSTNTPPVTRVKKEENVVENFTDRMQADISTSQTNDEQPITIKQEQEEATNDNNINKVVVKQESLEGTENDNGDSMDSSTMMPILPEDVTSSDMPQHQQEVVNNNAPMNDEKPITIIKQEQEVMPILSDDVTSSDIPQHQQELVNNNAPMNDEKPITIIKQEQEMMPILSEDITSSDIPQHQQDEVANKAVLVDCPICNQKLEYFSKNNQNDTIDSFLAAHMQTCSPSQQESSTRGGQRRQRRTRRFIGSYAEEEKDNSNKEKDKIQGGNVPRTSTTNKKDDIYYENASDGDSMDVDDEVLDITDSIAIQEDINELRATSSTAKTTTKRKQYSNKNNSNKEEKEVEDYAVDDYELEVYEDRIEEWIDNNGLTGVFQQKPKAGNTTSSTEEKPGTAYYYTSSSFSHHNKKKPNEDSFLCVPGWINNHLFPYQRISCNWLWELHNSKAGGLIGDEMGLGKTIQVCAFLQSMICMRKIRNVLIICPATLLHNWLNELKRWAPGFRRVLIHNSAESRDGFSRNIEYKNKKLLKNLDKWLNNARHEFVNEPVNEEDLKQEEKYSKEHDTDVLYVGTGYAVVTTYENIRKNCDIWKEHYFDYVVLDEGQKIRNPDAEITMACKNFSTPHRLLLSGTPIQNDLRELWSLFDFVFPCKLGKLSTFQQEFVDPIRQGSYLNASKMKKQLAFRKALALRDLINPYLLRRLKVTVLGEIGGHHLMPGTKTEQILFCKLSALQFQMYKKYLASDEVQRVIRGREQKYSVGGLGAKSHVTFRAIITLRKICNHPDLITDDMVDEEQIPKWEDVMNDNENIGDDDDDNGSTSEEEKEYTNQGKKSRKKGKQIIPVDTSLPSFIEKCGKLQVLAKILPLWKKQGHRVLIFCQWKKMLDLIQTFVELLSQNCSSDNKEEEGVGWKYLRMDGSTNIGSRQTNVDKFNSDPSYFLFLMTTRTGGVGLNLTGANRILMYDLDWNPQTDAQAKERCWRFGQTKDVTIYRLVCAGTIEEKIYHRQIYKTANANQILEDPTKTKDQKRLFTRKDLRDLFSLGDNAVHSLKDGGTGLNLDTSLLSNGEGILEPEDIIKLPSSSDETTVVKDGTIVNSDKKNDKNSHDDNSNTLCAILRSKGLAGIFDHGASFDTKNFKNTASQSRVDREMDQMASDATKESMKHLEQEYTQSRSRHTSNKHSNNNLTDPRRTTGSSSGIVTSSSNQSLRSNNNNVIHSNKNSASSSKSILDRLKRRRKEELKHR